MSAGNATGGSPREGASYRQAGVDIDAGNELVRRIGPLVRSTYTPEVLPGSHGGFAGLFQLFGGDLRGRLEDPVLVGATDGVGTKLKIAFATGRWDTVGIDLVAMCVNDLVVGGARPLFFLDYLATGAVDPTRLTDVVAGIAAGCRQARCALLGGETAEMPGFYDSGEFDLAGFCVGVVDRARILDGRDVEAGDALVALPSSGLHSNGYSLVRRVLLDGPDALALDDVLDEIGRPLGEELLEPTRIYAAPILDLLERLREPGEAGAADAAHARTVRAMAHITGGGLVENLPRVLPEGFGAALDRGSWQVPPIFELIRRRGAVDPSEMERVFNLGLGMVLVVAARQRERVVQALEELGEAPRLVGEVEVGSGVRFR